MGALVIGALRVDLGMETSGFQSGANAAQKQAQALGARLQSIGSGMSSVGRSITTVMAPVVAGIGLAVKSGLEYASSLGEVAQQLGVTTGELQTFRYAASQVGIEQEAMDKSLAKLTVNLGKAASGTSPAAKAFAALGVNVLDANGHVKSAGTVMPELADALAKIPDPAKRAAAEVAIFGKTGQQLDTLLAGGSAKMNELTSAAEKLGIVLSSDQIAKADDAADKLSAVKQVLGAKIAGIVADNADAIVAFVEKVANGIASVIDYFSNLPDGVQSGIAAFAGLAVAIGPVLMAVGSMLSTFGPLIGWIVKFVGVAAEAGTVSGALASIFSGLGAGGSVIVGALGPLLPIIAAVAAAGALIYANWDKIGPVLSELGAKFQEVLGPKITALVDTVKATLTELWNGPLGSAIRTVMGVLGEFMAAYTSVLGEALIRVIGAAIELVKGAFNVIGGAIKLVVSLLTGDWAGAWEAAKGIVGSVARALLGVMESLLPGITNALKNIYDAAKTWLMDKLGGAFEWVKSKIQAVGDKFKWLWDVTVGHSYIPDMVDGIASEMGRLDTVMVAQAGRAADKTAATFKALADEVKPLMDRLFPDEAAYNKWKAELDLIDRAEKAGADKGGLSPAAAAAARRKLIEERYPVENDPLAALGQIGSEPLVDTHALARQLGLVTDTIDENLVKRTTEQTAEVIGSFVDMAQGIVSSLDGMIQSFKKGDIVGGIMGVLDLVGQVANLVAGISGKSNPFQGVGSSAGASYGGARALGGPVVPGKVYRVGEQGSEYFSPGTRGQIVPDRGGRGAVYNIHGNLLTPEFFAQIQSMDDEAAMRGALGGANMVQTSSQKRGRMRMGRGR